MPSGGGEQPGGSWDPEGHWDVDNVGGKGRRRFNPDGTEVTHDGDPVYGPQQLPQPSARQVTGVALGTVLYWIISEGLRLFPPRNLVPIP